MKTLQYSSVSGSSVGSPEVNKGRRYRNHQDFRSAAGSLEINSNHLLKQMAEKDFLAGFVRAINAGLEIDSLYSTAARCLYDHLHYNMIVFQPAATLINIRPKAFASICRISCRSELVELTRIFKGLRIEDIEGHESLGLDYSRPGRIFNSCIYMNLPENMGRIALYWGENGCSNISAVICTDICDCFAAALKNSHKYEQLKELSMRDVLTGLFNRRVLEEMLVIEGERRDPVPMSMVLIDLDDFKKINDKFGHIAGDQVLAQVAAVFKQSIRSIDYAARYGGEEFAIMLTSQSAVEAAEFAQRLMRNLSGTIFTAMDNRIRLTISIGVAHSSGTDRFDARELLRQADLALYRAKKSGKNQACIAAARPVSPVININRKSKVRTGPVLVMAA